MAKNAAFGICGLCLAEGQLVRSHIIPDFMYRPLKVKEGKFHVFSDAPNRKPEIKQAGVWEHLLCANCDNVRVQKFENYAARALFKGAGNTACQDGANLILEGLDYPNMKLFLHSILWRMGVSKNAMFANVRLGARHEERLRKMILNDDPGGEQDYPVTLAAPLFEQEHIGDWTLSPDCQRLNGHHIYRCPVAGLLYNYWVTSAPIPTAVWPTFPKTDGSWVVIRRPIESIPFLMEVFDRIRQNNPDSLIHRESRQDSD